MVGDDTKLGGGGTGCNYRHVSCGNGERGWVERELRIWQAVVEMDSYRTWALGGVPCFIRWRYGWKIL